MSLKFQELIPVKSFSASSMPAPLTDIRMLDMTVARDDYVAKPLTELADSPDYRVSLVNTVSATEVVIWLRFPDGMANEMLNWNVVELRTAAWLDKIRENAQRTLECGLEFLTKEMDMLSYLSGRKALLGTKEDEAHRLIAAFRRHIDGDARRAHVSVNCYESAPGRRYHVKGYMGNRFEFNVGPLAGADTPSPGSLYGTCRIRDASYRFELSHGVLGDQLPMYYGAEELNTLVRNHMWRYAGEWHGSLADGDFVFHFEGVAK
jgi:hypothetical protein